MKNPNAQKSARVLALLHALIDQHHARVLVSPYSEAPGYWFGGGNLIQDVSGTIWMSGRYRNYGDSRTGLAAGERGVECALLRSDDGGQSFQKVRSWSKSDLSANGEVLSIEGTALHLQPDGSCELYVSSEKARPYPARISHFQKPGTGIWTIERMTGTCPETLDAATLIPVLDALDRPEYLHVKDPVVFDDWNGSTALIFCSHPFSWTSTNTGLALRQAGDQPFRVEQWEVVPRGPTWDVAVTRVTDRLPLPQLGCLAGQPPHSVYFYDGAECIHDHSRGKGEQSRPRGYSCEEIGGAFLSLDSGGVSDALAAAQRLSRIAPLFYSPWGTGGSRYVSTLVLESGILAIWEQAQDDGSQPLVGRLLPMAEVETLLR